MRRLIFIFIPVVYKCLYIHIFESFFVNCCCCCCVVVKFSSFFSVAPHPEYKQRPFISSQRPPSSGNMSFTQTEDAQSTRSGDTPGPNGHGHSNSQNLGDNNSEAGKWERLLLYLTLYRSCLSTRFSLRSRTRMVWYPERRMSFCLAISSSLFEIPIGWYRDDDDDNYDDDDDDDDDDDYCDNADDLDVLYTGCLSSPSISN